jgi:exodeoxyribonuclease VII large subunit
MLRVPVIASVGHHSDRTLIDDVAAVSCSTPTHAAEAAVPVDCHAARAALQERASRLDRQGKRAILDRARALAAAARAPADHVERHRSRLHQQLREMRASARRGASTRERSLLASAGLLERRARAAAGSSSREDGRLHGRGSALERSSSAALARRRGLLESLALALDGHDPQRTLERGYALVEDPEGQPVTSAATARRLAGMRLRLHDGTLGVRPEEVP